MTTTNDGAAEIKEEEPHPTHSFEWCWSNRRPTTITCNKAGTVEDVLKRSSQFRQDAEKHKDKEAVIIRDGRAISTHFPCSLIKNERLTLRYVRAVDKVTKRASGCVSSRKKEPSSKLVMFHVFAKGGKSVVKILKNPALKTVVQEVTVYAYKGEKVKQALRRDGRFLSTIFKKNCGLSQRSTAVNTEMSNLVDDLHEKTFQIILLNKLSPPQSQPGSLDEFYITQGDSQGCDPEESQDSPQQCSTTDVENNNLPNKKSEDVLREIPCSKTVLSHLSSKFNDSIKGVKTQVRKLSRIQNLFRVEYGKNTQTCTEVKTMKRLMKLGDSVCQVRINGRAAGSGFLLFDKFVLTNAHVIKDIYDDGRRQLDETLTVHFSYESLEQTEGGSVKVEEVVGFEYCPDVSPCDWALLRLGANENLPRGLLTHFGFLPKSGAICIIGHPGDGVKKIDPCLIVSTENRNQVVDQHHNKNKGHVQLVTQQFFESVAARVQQNKQVLTYESCFYRGSSGSPVFDKHCNVVAVHSGGYSYPGPREETSVIEFGHALSDIMEHVIIQMVETGRFEVLKDFLACSFARRNDLLVNVKKLVESRNRTTFKNAVNNSANISEKSLKELFEFFSRVEEPVLMDID